MRVLGDKYGYSAYDYVQSGVVSEARGRLNEAGDCDTKALETKKDAPEILYRLGMTLRQVDDLAGVRNCFEQLLARNMHHPDLFTELRKIYNLQHERGLTAALRGQAAAMGIDHGR